MEISVIFPSSQGQGEALNVNKRIVLYTHMYRPYTGEADVFIGQLLLSNLLRSILKGCTLALIDGTSTTTQYKSLP